MGKTYLINEKDDGDFTYVIKAENQAEALDKFAEAHFLKDSFWLEESRRLHLMYYNDEHGDFYDAYTGNLRKDIAEMENQNEYIDKHVEEGLSVLFKDNLELVKYYMDFYNGEIESLSLDFLLKAYKAVLAPDSGWDYIRYSITEVTYDEDGVFGVII